MAGRNIKTGRIFTDDLDAVNINLSGNFSKDGITFDPFAWKKTVNDLSYTAGKVGVGTNTPDATFQIGEPSQYTIPISAWAKTIQGIGSEYIYDIAIDSIGNVYVIGKYNSSSDIDLGNNVILLSNTNSDTFIIKYNKAGTVQWANTINGSSDTSGKGIAVDSGGNVYVTGDYNSSSDIDLGNSVILPLTTSTGTDGFIVKYNTTGTAQWKQTIKGTGTDGGNGIAVDSSGNVYVSGDYISATTIHLGNNVILPITASTDGFIVKYNTTGTAQWKQTIKGTGVDKGLGVDVDSGGNVYMIGNYNSVDIIEFGNNISLPSTTNSDTFIIKYNTIGTAEWAHTINGSSDTSGKGVAVDSGGNVYVTGDYNSSSDIDLGNSVILPLTTSTGTDGFIVKYNTTGTAQWKQTIKGTGTDGGNGIATDSGGNVYVTGNYSSTSTIDLGNNVILPITTSIDGFIVKYNTTGITQWYKTIYGTSNDIPRGIAIDSNGSVYVSGDYISTSTIDLGNNVILPITIDGTSRDGFVVKYTNVPTATPDTSLFVTGNVQIGDSKLFVDTTSSKVGIGTNTPDALLHVAGNVYTSSNLTVSGDALVSGEVTIGDTMTFVVTVKKVNDVNKYFINGVDRALLELNEQQTYIFDLSDNSLVGHPFRFSETNTNDGTSNGTPYTTGIQTTGVYGSTEKRTFIVPVGSPTIPLYYYCEIHSGMGATVSISPSVPQAADLTIMGDTVLGGVTRIEGATSVSNVMTIGTTKTFVVRAVTGAYYIDEVIRKPLKLHEHQTYNFDLSDNSLLNDAHPLLFSTGGTDGNGTEYSAGITPSGAPGTTGAKITFVVPVGATSPISYYCSSHPGMGSTMSISATADLVVSGHVESTGLVVTGTDGITINGGTTLQRPVNALLGTMRYNSTHGYMEVYTVDGWTTLATAPKINAFSPTETAFSSGNNRDRSPSAPPVTKFYHQDELHHWDPQSSDQFGSSVSISADGTRAIVGARYDDQPPQFTSNPGSAHTFVRLATDDFWTYEAQLVHPDPANTDYFGWSVSMSDDGNRVIVGVQRDDSPSDTGSAQIFVRDASGHWTWEYELRNPLEASSDYFGHSVAISGDGTRAIVGAYLDDHSTSGVGDTGSAHIFVRDATTTPISWTHEKELRHEGVTGQTVNSSDQFGWSVSISTDGSLAIVGARYTDSPVGDAGSAYVFKRTVTAWDLEQRLTNTGGYLGTESSDYFGHSVAISGDGTRVIVGAWGDNGINTNVNDVGSAHIFRRDTTTTPISWVYEKELQHTTSMENEAGTNQSVSGSDQFGYSVSISNDGNRVIAGARYTDLGWGDAGSAYVFDRTTGTNDWTLNTMLVHPNPASSDYFGESVAISGDGTHTIVAVYRDTGTTLDGTTTLPSTAGSAQIFNLKSQPFDTESQIFTATGTGFANGSTLKLVGADETLYDVFDVTTPNAAGTEITFKLGAVGRSGGYDRLQRPYKLRVNSITGQSGTSVATIGVVGRWTTPSRAFVFSTTVDTSYTLSGIDADGNTDERIFTLAPGSAALPGTITLGLTTGILTGRFTVASPRTEVTFRLTDTGSGNDHFEDRKFVIEASSSEPTITAISPTQTPTNGYIEGFYHQDELHHWDPQGGDQFGYSVSISADGTRAIVGARYDDQPPQFTSNPGSAHTFVRLATDDFWTYEAQLVHPDPANTDYFGWSVSMSDDGNRVIVGVQRDDISTGSTGDTGSAQIFVRDVNGNWTWEYELRNPLEASGDYFGSSVDISGDGTRAIVGAYLDEHSTLAVNDTGSAHIFVRDATTTPISWTHEKELRHEGVTGQTVNSSDQFGCSVSISTDGSLAIVGAQYTDSPEGNAGSAYVFKRTVTTWDLEQRLTNTGGYLGTESSDYFGHSVAISGDGTRVIVGAWGDNGINTNVNDVGSAHIFRRDTTTTPISWVYEKELQHTTSMQSMNSSDHFGYSVSISNDGNRVIAGAPNTNLGGGDAGSAYIFDRTTGTNDWTFNKMLVHPTPASSDYFGYSVAISGDGTYTIMGVYSDDGTTLDGTTTLPGDAGSAQIFNLKPQFFDTETQVFTATGTGFANGSTVQLQGQNGALYSVVDTTVPNATGTEITFKMGVLGRSGGYDKVQSPYKIKVNSTTGQSGTSTVMIGVTGGWVTGSRAFVFSTTVDTSYTLVGTDGNGGTNRTFTLAPGSAALPGTITLGSTTGILIGQFTAASSRTEVTFRLTDTASGAFEDRIFVIEASSSQPAITAILPASTSVMGGYQVGKFGHQDEIYNPYPDSSDNFGYSVSISADGTRAIVGARYDDQPNRSTSNPGGAHIYTRLSTDDFWTYEAKLVHPELKDSDHFGWSVSMSDDGNRVIVGAYVDDIERNPSNTSATFSNAGSAQIFSRDAYGVWTWEDELLLSSAHSLTANDYFGFSVDISGDGTRAIVGAYGDDVNGSDTGTAQIFRRDATANPITWIWEKQLTHAGVSGQTVSTSDQFGYSVSISTDGSLAIVGARYTDSPVGDAGSAYVFKRTVTAWDLEQRLTSTGGYGGTDGSDYFGSSVDISGDGTRVIVGAYGDNGINTNLSNQGSAHIFRRDATTTPISWVYEKELQHTSSMQSVNSSDQFGYSVSISNDGNRVIAGARYTNLGGADAGSAYVFDRTTGTNDWTFNTMLVHPSPASSDYFGESVAISGDGTYTIVGVYRDTGTTLDGTTTLPSTAGSAQIFNLKSQPFDTESQIFTATGTGFANGSTVQLQGQNGTLYSVVDTTVPNATGTEITFKLGKFGRSGGYDRAQSPYKIKVNSITGQSGTSTATIGIAPRWTTGSRAFIFSTTKVISYTLVGTNSTGVSSALTFSISPLSPVQALPGTGLSLNPTIGVLSGQITGTIPRTKVTFRLTDTNTALFEDRIFVIEGTVDLYPFTSHRFTSGGQFGRNGPTITQLREDYAVTWDSEFALGMDYLSVTSGVQEWTVPVTGSYEIEAAGASAEWGRYSTNNFKEAGRGAIMTGTFTLTQNEIIKIVVGQMGDVGQHTQDSNGYVSGGGGGSYVIRTPYNDTGSILVIAGGGGGSSGYSNYTPYAKDASTSTSGVRGGNNNGGTGGTGGAGGNGANGGAGAGFTGDGATPSGTSQTDSAQSFTDTSYPSRGGRNGRSWGGAEIYGGFGGGGGGGGLAAGGGGGYSGGGSGQWNSNGGGGGGGSYNSSSINTSSSIRTVRAQNGYVKITKL